MQTLPVEVGTRAYCPPRKVVAVTGLVQATSGKTVPVAGSTQRRTETGLEHPDKMRAATEAQNVAGTAADFFTSQYYRKWPKRGAKNPGFMRSQLEFCEARIRQVELLRCRLHRIPALSQSQLVFLRAC